MSAARSSRDRRKSSLLYNPQRAQHRLSGRAVRGDRVPGLERDQQRARQSGARQDRLRLRLLEQHRRLRHQPDADRLFARTSTYGRAFWVGLLNTLLVAGARHRARDHARLCRSASRGCRRTGWWRGSPAAMSRSSATCRCCCNCCSGTTPCSRRCRSIRDSVALPGGGFLNNRGLFLPQPVFGPGFDAVR